MRLGIFAKTFKGDTPAAVLGAARDAGYAAVQYNMACSGLSSLPETIPEAAADAIATAARQTGVAVAAISATYNMIDPDRARRERGRRAFAAIAETAGRVGAPLVTLCTGSRDAQDQWRAHPDNDTPDSWRDMMEEFARILPVAERCGIAVGVEPELANVVSSADRARRMLDELKSPHMRIVLDPANLFEVAPVAERNARIERAADLLGPSIALAHAKDRAPDGGFAAAGDGVVDFPLFFRALKRNGFDGVVVTHGLNEPDAPRVARFLRNALAEAGAA